VSFHTLLIVIEDVMHSAHMSARILRNIHTLFISDPVGEEGTSDVKIRRIADRIADG
jgi:hypothetical protein